jgi:peptidoglycan/xylan/chitin deacetylase (PgdA/CDA1 family)
MKKPLRSLAFLLIIFAGCTDAPAVPVTTPTKTDIVFKNTAVSLTFDDGDADNYAVLSTLAENNLNATFYIVSGFTNSNGYMTDNQLRDLPCQS